MTQEKQEKYKPLRIIFVASSTPEKLRDFQVIAKAHGWPIIFADARELIGTYHQADEIGGKFNRNAHLKRKEIEPYIRKIRASKEPLKKWCAQNNVPFDPKHIFFLTEDTGFKVEKAIWDAVNKDGIPDHLLGSIGKDTQGGGPGVETGPVVNATLGSEHLMRRILRAAATALKHKEQIKSQEFSSVCLTCVDDEHTYEHNVSIDNYLRNPETTLPRRISNYSFIRPHSHPYTTCSDMGSEYIAHHSARAKIVDYMARSWFKLTDLDKVNASFHRPVSKEYSIGVIPLPESSLDLSGLQKSAATLAEQAGITAPHFVLPPEGVGKNVQRLHSKDISKKAAYILSEVERVLQQSNAVVLPPLETESAETHMHALYQLMSLVVAKQLIPRDGNKPVMVCNFDHSWDPVTDIHYDLANQSLTKEHNILLPVDVNGNAERIQALSNSYFCELSGKHKEKMDKAAAYLLSKEREGFVPRANPRSSRHIESATLSSISGYKVAVFCSASNENRVLNQTMQNLGYRLSKNKNKILYGGGDKYTMGALLNGVLEWRTELTDNGAAPTEAKAQSWIGGITTPTIEKSETVKGKLSEDLNYRHICENIYERMAELLIHSDSVVVAPGGAGTVQEWMAALLLRKAMPEHFAHKPIIVFNPPLLQKKEHLKEHERKVWDKTLKLVLGKDYELLTAPQDTLTPQKLIEQQQRSAELGIFVETELGGVAQKIEMFKAKKEKMNMRPRALAHGY